MVAFVVKDNNDGKFVDASILPNQEELAPIIVPAKGSSRLEESKNEDLGVEALLIKGAIVHSRINSNSRQESALAFGRESKHTLNLVSSLAKKRESLIFRSPCV